MTDLPDVPEAAARRLGSGSFSSGLTVPDFAACLQMGLQPVGLVQGFCVMQWGWYNQSTQSQLTRGMSPFTADRGAYSEAWYCPHGFYSLEHPAWGQNFEQTWVEQAWTQGFSSAFTRMMEEAKALGAHGVVGVTDSSRFTNNNVTEFHMLGTAVVVEDAVDAPAAEPWSTYLAGQRLAKLIEAGFAPVSVVATLTSVRVWAYCITKFLMEGMTYAWVPFGGAPLIPGQSGWAAQAAQEVEQVTAAHLAARELARDRVRRQLVNDTLHGALIGTSTRELAGGDQVVECTLRGTRVRRFKDFDPMPAPLPTLRLS